MSSSNVCLNVFPQKWADVASIAAALERAGISDCGVVDSPDTLRQLAAQDLGTTVAEDVRLVESVQRGLESGGYRPSPLIIDPAGGVNSEHSIRALYGWLDQAMRG